MLCLAVPKNCWHQLHTGPMAQSTFLFVNFRGDGVRKLPNTKISNTHVWRSQVGSEEIIDAAQLLFFFLVDKPIQKVPGMSKAMPGLFFFLVQYLNVGQQRH